MNADRSPVIVGPNCSTRLLYWQGNAKASGFRLNMTKISVDSQGTSGNCCEEVRFGGERGWRAIGKVDWRGAGQEVEV